MSVHVINRRGRHEERGAVLALCLIILALLSILGVAALNSTDMEMMISANERDHKEAFFYADGGTGVGSEMVEQSVEEGTAPVVPGLVVNDADFFMRDRSWDNGSVLNPATSSLNAYVNGTQGTFIWIGGIEGPVAGSALQVGSGYEGLGKSASQGGTKNDYLIRSRRLGARNSQSEVDVEWRHIN